MHQTLCQDPALAHVIPQKLHNVRILISNFAMRTEEVSDAIVCALNY